MGAVTFTNTTIAGLLLVDTFMRSDERGIFHKPFNYIDFAKHKLECDFKEHYYSISRTDVIRGMHFQTPPSDHVKLVYVSTGRIVDVVLDIRKNSPTFATYQVFNLGWDKNQALYIPKGCAHGFKSLEDNTTVVYTQTSIYDPAHDMGIRYDSFGYDWNVAQPIISDRDLSFPLLENYPSPF